MADSYKDRRKRLRLTQAQLARLFDVSRATLARWEIDNASAKTGLVSLAFERLESMSSQQISDLL